MKSDEIEKKLHELEGQSSSKITKTLANLLGDEGMVNNLIKMCRELKLEKEIVEREAKRQGFLSGVTMGITLTTGVVAIGCCAYSKCRERMNKKNSQIADVLKEKKLNEYQEELQKIEEVCLREEV